ncbi:MAG: lamin tail domain-containing protein [bacterium]
MRFRGTTFRFQIIVILLVLAGFGITMVYRPVYTQAEKGAYRPKKAEIRKDGPYTLVRVIDGDTIVVSPSDDATRKEPASSPSSEGQGDFEAIHVRYLGINTPERDEKFFKEAGGKNRELIGEQSVYLEYEAVTEDHYGRKLAYIWAGDTLVNQAMLEAGYAHLFVIPPAKRHYDEFLKAEKAAREMKDANGKVAPRGIWADKEYRSSLHITSFHANPSGDESKDPNLEYLRVCNISLDPISLIGYKLTDAQRHAYFFPDVTLPPGYTVVVFSGKGPDLTDPSRPIELYWGAPYPIWNNSGDTATIYDPKGKRVDSKTYEPGRRVPSGA